MSNEKILDKIKKLLRLATSDNAHEAALALSRAKELMDKHQLTESDVRLSEVKEQVADQRGPQKPNLFTAILAKSIAKLFGCAFHFSYGLDQKGLFKSTCVFIGQDPHHEIAAYALDVTHAKLLKARQAFMDSLNKRTKPANKKAKADAFAVGWAHGIMMQVEKLVPGAEPCQAVQEYVAKKELTDCKTRKSKHTRKGDESVTAGYIAGLTEQINAGVGSNPANRLQLL